MKRQRAGKKHDGGMEYITAIQENGQNIDGGIGMVCVDNECRVLWVESGDEGGGG